MRKKKPKLDPSKPKKPPNPWVTLVNLITEYGQALVNESWKGGGDPAHYEIVELELKLHRAKLNAHIQEMKRELD